jgi:hypothetical protein
MRKSIGMLLLSVTTLCCGETATTDPLVPNDGSPLPVGSRSAFVLNQFAIREEGSAYAALAPVLNDVMRQSLLGGETMLLAELAIDTEHEGTLSLLRVEDADDPFFPANNFRPVEGDASCCEFLVDPISFDANAPKNLAAISIDGSNFESAGATAFRMPLISVSRFDGSGGELMFIGALDRVVVRGSFSEDALAPVTIDGVVRIETLAFSESGFCRTASPHCPPPLPQMTLLDFYAFNGLRLDVDLDGDGLERLIDLDGDGAFDACRDGDGTEVAAVDPAVPSTCAQSPQMRDGFTVSLQVGGVPAKIVGVAN